MYSVGYFTSPYSGTGGGTGLTPEQTQLLEDVQTWQDTRSGTADLSLLEALNEVNVWAKNGNDAQSWRSSVVPSKYASTSGITEATAQANWAKVLESDQIQSSALTTANPDNFLTTDGKLITSLASKADATTVTNLTSTVAGKANTSTVNNLETALVRITPKQVTITQPVPNTELVVPTATLKPFTTYVCSPTSNYGSLDHTLLHIGYPTETESYEVTIVNRSPNDTKIRIYCSTPTTQWNNLEYVTFARGNTENAIWSTALIVPGRALRLVYYPASLGVFSRYGQYVRGFMEYDEEADASHTLQPVNNT